MKHERLTAADALALAPEHTQMYLKSNVATPKLPLSHGIPKSIGMESAMDTARIAILDDDQSVRTAISRLLKASQMAAESFASYLELLNYLERDRLDCLVLDLQMPGMNGIDVLHYLEQRGIRLPTVMITAHDGPGARESCLAAGALAYVRKPWDAQTLLDAIRLAVEGGRRDAAAHIGPSSN